MGGLSGSLAAARRRAAVDGVGTPQQLAPVSRQSCGAPGAEEARFSWLVSGHNPGKWSRRGPPAALSWASAPLGCAEAFDPAKRSQPYAPVDLVHSRLGQVSTECLVCTT